MEGGETSFPRWLHADGKSSSSSLKVKPERGKAILFYSLLPDGNYDERSEHAALPVTKGEKWLTNLVRNDVAIVVYVFRVSTFSHCVLPFNSGYGTP